MLPPGLLLHDLFHAFAKEGATQKANAPEKPGFPFLSRLSRPCRLKINPDDFPIL
jgi:hypothetical protein